MKAYNELRVSLNKKGLKVTPQRIAVLEAVLTLNHPSTDRILEYVHLNFPGVARGTAYNILESFVEKGLICKVKTDNGVMRYDAVLEKHHHLYCVECDVVEDYYDEELGTLLENYFANKKIANFLIDDIKLQIVGKFHFNNQ